MIKLWDCKIGFAASDELPDGADAPMRQAVEKAFKELTGRDCSFCLSGWGGKLTDAEKDCLLEAVFRRQALKKALK